MNATAAVFHTPGQPLELQRIALPQLNAGEALVQVDCCTVCGSDLHSIHGERQVPVPTVLGHEITGRLVDLGGVLEDADGHRLQAGDRICWSITASCGQCFYCRNEIPQKCVQLFKYGHEALSDSHPLSGGLATHCHLHSNTSIVRIPDDVPDHVAAPASCATATVAAALRTAGDCQDRTVVIVGAGMLGLTAAAMARFQGAAAVIVTDINADRLLQAPLFGATHTTVDSLSDITDGRGADIVLDMSGSADAMEQGLNLLRVGGVLILVGAVFPTRPLSIPAEQLVRKMIRVEGVHNYRPDDLVRALQFLSQTQQQYPFADMVGNALPLEQINEAIREAGRGSAFRIAICPQQTGDSG